MLFWILGGLIALAGLAAAAWCLCADRARGKKRCPKCWYSMEGASGLTCPECGRAVKSERGLLRTRRRWGRAGLGSAVALLGAAVAALPLTQRGAVVGWLPRSVLAVMVELTGTSGGTALAELQARANASVPVCNGWREWEVRWLVRGCIRDIESEQAIRSRIKRAWRQTRTIQSSGSPDNAYISSSGTLLVGLAANAVPVVPTMIREYNQRAGAEDELLEVFKAIAVGDSRVVEAVVAKLLSPGGAGDVARIDAIAKLAADSPLQSLALSGLRRVFDSGERAGRLAALRTSVLLEPGCASTRDMLVLGGIDADDRLAAEAVEQLCLLSPTTKVELARIITAGRPGTGATLILRSAAVGRIDGCELATIVLKDRARTQDTDARWWAAAIIHRCLASNPDLEPLLIETLGSDSSRSVRATALAALGTRPLSGPGISAVLARLRDDDPIVRKVAVGALASSAVTSQSILIAIRELCADPDPGVAKAVSDVLLNTPAGGEDGERSGSRSGAAAAEALGK